MAPSVQLQYELGVHDCQLELDEMLFLNCKPPIPEVSSVCNSLRDTSSGQSLGQVNSILILNNVMT